MIGHWGLRARVLISAECELTVHSFDDVGHVQLAAGGQSPQEGGRVCSALEALAGLQETLAVIHLQVHDGAEGGTQPG